MVVGQKNVHLKLLPVSVSVIDLVNTFRSCMLVNLKDFIMIFLVVWLTYT